MLRWCETAGMLRTVLLFFPLFLLLSLLSSFLFFVVSFLLLMLLFMRIRTTYIRCRGLLSTEYLPRLVLVLLVLIFVFSLRSLIYVSILFWQLQNCIMLLSNLNTYIYSEKI